MVVLSGAKITLHFIAELEAFCLISLQEKTNGFLVSLEVGLTLAASGDMLQHHYWSLLYLKGLPLWLAVQISLDLHLLL